MSETKSKVCGYISMDDKNKVGSPDRNLISAGESYEVEYWSKKFGVTADELIEAVKAVGNSAEAVGQHLGK